MDITERIEDIFNNWTSLHNHDYYSFLDGAGKPSEYAKRAKELGMKAIAETNHNHLGGVIEFQKACQKEGIKPILGCEMYWTWDTNILSKPVEERNAMAQQAAIDAGAITKQDVECLSDKKTKKEHKDEIKSIIKQYQYDVSQYHIILLAINQTGWSNLVKLQSEAADKCTYNGRFLCDNEMLEKYSEGLIMSTACIGNSAAELIICDRTNEAFKLLGKWHEIFGDRFYLEIQPLNIPKQWPVNLAYIQYAQEHDIKIIATVDAHYVLKEDYDDHDTLLCVGTGAYKDDGLSPDEKYASHYAPNILKERKPRMRYSHDFWLKSYEEMIDSFNTQAESMNEWCGLDTNVYLEIVERALENTNEIADMIEDIQLGSPKPLFPEVKIPFGFTPERWLTQKCWQKLYAYKAKNPEINLRTYTQRLKSELTVINNKGFAPYMLGVDEYVQWAENNGCPVGPGRGSAAGSLVLYLLGVTKKIDPIEYELLFSRFLTEDRTSPPDIDLDFEYNNRLRVVDHLEDLYGKAKVAHVGTYTEMGVKSGLKDFGRVLRVPFEESNAISKKIDEILEKPDLSFKDLDALKDSEKDADRKAWEEFDKLEKRYQELFRLARRFEGTPRNMGVHASGVLITPMAIADLFPTRKDKNGATVTLYHKDQLEELNAIKFDILGLKTISVIVTALSFIDPDLTMQDLYDVVDVNDPNIYEMICAKKTDGLFQIESDMFKGMVDDIKPDCLNDIIAITSLGRPGPLKAGMPRDYAACKHGDKDITEPLPNTMDIVANTYGQIVYQEQFMQICVRVSGFNTNQSDSIARKIVGKKKKESMEMLRRMMIYGKVNAVGPEGWEEDSTAPWYDPKAKYGEPIPGAVNKGYTVQQMMKFWDLIQGFCDYMFNKSHAATYSYITVLTGYLKRYYPTEFLAALLTMTEVDEKKEKYIMVAEGMGIKVKAPDVNQSGISFTPADGNILYGIGGIKGVGESSIPMIMAQRPFTNIEDAMVRIGKKGFNKTVGISLIKAGAFDWQNTNRFDLMNHFYNLRKDKDERLDPEKFNEASVIEMEKSVLGAPITYKPWWDTIKPGDKFTAPMMISELREQPDRNGNMMAFATGIVNECEVPCVIFSNIYCKNSRLFDKRYHPVILITGKKNDRGKCLIDKVSEHHQIENRLSDIIFA